MNDTNKDMKRELLIYYLNDYLSKKDIKMKGLLSNVKKKLEIDKPISIRQFLSFIRFIERERPFKANSREEIVKYFSPLLYIQAEDQFNETTAG